MVTDDFDGLKNLLHQRLRVYGEWEESICRNTRVVSILHVSLYGSTPIYQF